MPPKIETLGIQHRAMVFDRASVDEDTRSVPIAISSEEPVDRWFGREVLDHSSLASIRMDRAGSANGLPLLWGHDAESMDSLLGRVTDFELGSDRVLRGVAHLGTSEAAGQALALIKEGTLTDISVGYRIHELRTENPGKPTEIQRATDWEPLEVSLVSVPADSSVGVGRNASAENPAELHGEPAAEDTTPAPVARSMEVPIMETTPMAAPQAAPINHLEERQEALQLMALAGRFDLAREAAEILSATANLTEARAKVLELMSSKPLPAPSLAVDMSKKEAKEYSYARAILNSVLRQEGMAIGRSLEDEVSETLAKNLPGTYKARGGTFVPMQTRAGLDSATSTAGAELKFTEYGGELIELLRNYSAVAGMGARMLTGLNGPVTFPKQTAAGTAYWMGENGGSDVSASALTLGTVTLTPKTLASTTSFSRQLLQQSILSVESMVRNDLAAIHALAIDHAAIHGSGTSNEPTGIYKTTSINTKAMGGVPTFALLQDMITAVAVSNALLRSLGWLTTPGMAGKMAQTLVASAAGSDMIWTGDYQAGQMNGYKAVATNQVSAVMNVLADTGGSSHGIIFGNFDDLLVGQWGALEIITDPYALKKQGMIEVTSFQMADIQVRHPASFACATGATIA